MPRSFARRRAQQQKQARQQMIAAVHAAAAPPPLTQVYRGELLCPECYPASLPDLLPAARQAQQEQHLP